jgi:hypothetical protein
LVEGAMDSSPMRLEANARRAFQGSILLGMGFTFDDSAAAKGESEPLSEMKRLIATEPRNAKRIKPYIGGEEVNNSPTHAHHRFAIDFFDFPLRRDPSFKSWFEWSEKRMREGLREGTVPVDYPDEVAGDWPDLLEIVERRVKPDRVKQDRKALRQRWWQYHSISAATRKILNNCVARYFSAPKTDIPVSFVEDCRNCQTSTATPAEPGDLPWGLDACTSRDGRSSYAIPICPACAMI